MSRGGDDYYYHYDGLGSVTEVTDSNGTVVESYMYDAYGNSSVTGSLIGNPYMFTGRRWDEESGIYYYRARQYDPMIGRFLQRDPIGYYDGMNMFAYTHNNPINYTDPDGELALLTVIEILKWTLLGVSIFTTIVKLKKASDAFDKAVKNKQEFDKLLKERRFSEAQEVRPKILDDSLDSATSVAEAGSSCPGTSPSPAF